MKIICIAYATAEEKIYDFLLKKNKKPISMYIQALDSLFPT